MLKIKNILFALSILVFSCVSENVGDNRAADDGLVTEDTILAKGYPIPAFQLKIVGQEQLISNETLLGKFYLMDFWAVWCAPCILEMPVLHKAFEKFKNDNFTIISLSLDFSWENVEKFREHWEMPWLHTFLEGSFENSLAKRFGVVSIPSPILIGPDGNVLAMGVELRGQALEKTLTKYLKNPETTATP